ncbi:DedA family protein [uncultured Sphingomonas sp.]|uniref:DedA family protein n=1 Tax=uncultured Sphingomonas sp. TaxID=158754 RepID=UPI0025D69EAC|nr:DedA family protein [uncultured Sphingomonas sp.]
MTDWISTFIETAGLAGIAALMFLENLFPPIPSEVIMPMAGLVSAEGKLALPGVIAAGLTGTLMGATLWYGVARWASEARLKRWVARHGRWITMNPAEIDRLEDWFRRHGHGAVPLARLVPGLRTLISIPAGLFGVAFGRFLLLSALGAGAWVGILATAGYYLGRSFDGIDRILEVAGTVVLIAAFLLYLYRLATFRSDCA